MSVEYSIELCKTLEKEFHALGLHRPMRFRRYDEGTELILEMQGVDHPHQGKVHLNIDQFVGGGFAGQVYRVKILDVQTENGHMGILEKNKMYALKIFIPPSPFSRLFRNILYWIGFQGPFQPQVNPAAAKAGAIWQKFIRRATKIRFGDERAVNDIHAIIVDPHLGSCGELSDWVDGRTWKLEVDDHMDVLKRYIRDKSVDTNLLGSPEYRAKKQFMREFVKLLHHMGGHEFARQYEWSTGKVSPTV